MTHWDFYTRNIKTKMHSSFLLENERALILMSHLSYSKTGQKILIFTFPLEQDKIGKLWKVDQNMKKKKNKGKGNIKNYWKEYRSLNYEWSQVKMILNTCARVFNSYVSLLSCENSIDWSRIPLSEGSVGWQMFPLSLCFSEAGLWQSIYMIVQWSC